MLEASWASFTAELQAHPVPSDHQRAVVDDRFRWGARPLFIDASRIGSVSSADTAVISTEIVSALRMALASGSLMPAEVSIDDTDPAWLRAPVARRRTDVWIACGILMARYHLGAIDALALLRSYAYGHDGTIDDTAAVLIGGTLDPAELAP